MAREVLVVSRQDAPGRRALLLRPDARLMEAEEPIEAVLKAITGRLVEKDSSTAAGQQEPLYCPAETTLVEGAELQLGDLTLRPARAMKAAGAELLGLLVEAEYAPLLTYHPPAMAGTAAGPAKAAAPIGAAGAEAAGAVLADLLVLLNAALREAGLTGKLQAVQPSYEKYGYLAPPPGSASAGRPANDFLRFAVDLIAAITHHR